MSSGMDFELYISQTVKKRYPQNVGYTVYEQYNIPDVGILDFYVVRGRERIVIDAKDKGAITKSDIQQVDDYARKLSATERIVYIANDTDVPNSVKDEADRLAIQIIRTQYRS
jgi:hypothetical protein